MTIDDDLRDDVRPFADPAARRGDVTILHFALPSPMTEAFAALPGAGAAVSQHYAGRLFRAVRCRGCSGSLRLAGASSATLVGRVDLALGESDFNRQELEASGSSEPASLPIAVDTGR